MMLADEGDNEDDIFVYMGGDQQVPERVRRARIPKSLKIVPRRAFYRRMQLEYVEFHDDIQMIEEEAFHFCVSLSGCIKLLGVKVIKESAFYYCQRLTDVEFGDKLETIEENAFNGCTALKKIRMPSVRRIKYWAFFHCNELSDVEFGQGLRTIHGWRRIRCLRRIGTNHLAIERQHH